MDAEIIAFWRWFLDGDEERYATVERWYANRDDPEATRAVMGALDAVNRALSTVDEHLAINFGPPSAPGQHELVLTVEGQREGMAALEAVASASPALARWQLVKYKPPIGDGGLSVTYNGLVLSAKDITCAAADVDGEVVVVLFLAGLGEGRDDDHKGAALVLLDGVIGEWRALAKIDVLHCAPASTAPHLPRIPLAELGTRLDALRPDPAEA